MSTTNMIITVVVIAVLGGIGWIIVSKRNAGDAMMKADTSMEKSDDSMKTDDAMMKDSDGAMMDAEAGVMMDKKGDDAMMQ